MQDASESDKCLNSAMQQFRDGQHTFELRVRRNICACVLMEYLRMGTYISVHYEYC